MNQQLLEQKRHPVDLWPLPAVISENNFVHKSLSNWSFNISIGCIHGCRFCYVPATATVKQGPKLKEFGVNDPDAEWGQYVLLRTWDEKKFMASLKKAEKTATEDLKPDGNRAIMLCTTTDPYQTLRHPDSARQKELMEHSRFIVRRSLELIRDHSTLNVRILTRSPLAIKDFDLYQSLGKRLLFGMSLASLNDNLASIYEPNAPGPAARLRTLHAARDAGINVYVAMAPTPPECDAADLRKTLEEIRELNPVTIFHEPINIRAENVARIAEHAKSLGVTLNTAVYASSKSWSTYALDSLKTVERIAHQLNLDHCLHLWPDKALANKELLARIPDPDAHLAWLNSYWSKISAWPTA